MQNFRALGVLPQTPVPPKFESRSQKRKRKEEKRTKSKEVESRCKKISQFFPYVNEHLADPTSHQSLS